jgi:hypothetical protein
MTDNATPHEEWSVAGLWILFLVMTVCVEAGLLVFAR